MTATAPQPAIHLHPQRLRSLPLLDKLALVVDAGMVVLVIANLALILFDWAFSSAFIQTGFATYVPAFHDFYSRTIHDDFIFYDLIFVSIYLTEFFVRWAFAIGRRTYHRWFFYPFVHWYDLLGCIPVGSFRWLRILRLVGLAIRLQRLGVIDLRDTRIGATLIKYYRIVVEEISDRVVINVLEGAQREIDQGSPLLHRIQEQVLQPRKSVLVEFIADRLTGAAEQTHRQYRDALGRYLSRLTDEGLARTRSGALLAAIPVAGPRTLQLLGDTVRELGVALVDQLVEDLTVPAHRTQLDNLIADLLSHANVEGNTQVDTLLRELLIEILEQVKIQVAVQHWKMTDAAGPAAS